MWHISKNCGTNIWFITIQVQWERYMEDITSVCLNLFLWLYEL